MRWDVDGKGFRRSTTFSTVLTCICIGIGVGLPFESNLGTGGEWAREGERVMASAAWWGVWGSFLRKRSMAGGSQWEASGKQQAASGKRQAAKRHCSNVFSLSYQRTPLFSPAKCDVILGIEEGLPLHESYLICPTPLSIPMPEIHSIRSVRRMNLSIPSTPVTTHIFPHATPPSEATRPTKGRGGGMGHRPQTTKPPPTCRTNTCPRVSNGRPRKEKSTWGRVESFEPAPTFQCINGPFPTLIHSIHTLE